MLPPQQKKGAKIQCMDGSMEGTTITLRLFLYELETLRDIVYRMKSITRAHISLWSLLAGRYLIQ